MRLLAKLTIRSLIKNRWRTLATMAAITLSTVMLVSVTTLASSAMNALKQREILVSGNWHSLYLGVRGDALPVIEEDERTAASAITQGIGYLQGEAIYHTQRPYYYMTAVDEKGFAIRPYPLLEGRYPTNGHEVMIPVSLTAINAFDRHIGEDLTATLGRRIDDSSGDLLFQNSSYDAKTEHFEPIEARSYTIVGIYDDTYATNPSSAGFDLFCGLDAIIDDAAYDVYVQDAQVDASLYTHAQQLCADSGCNGVEYNRYLLLYEGVSGDSQLVMMLRLLTGTLCAIVLISSSIVIRNSFAISLSQRSRYLGMLASVGATRRQKQQSVFLEALFLSVPAILAGTLIALGATACVLAFIDAQLRDFLSALHLSIHLDPTVLALTILTAFAAVWISAWRPAHRAGKIAAITAIRQNDDITLPTHYTRSSPWIQRLFGYTAVLGIKNQKRFRSRYYAVLCSLILSFVLFVSISALSSYIARAMTMANDQLPFDLEVQVDKGTADALPATDALLKLPQAETSMRMQRITLFIEDDSLFSDELRAYQQERGLLGLNAYVISLDPDNFSALCKATGIDSTQSDPSIAFAVNVGSEQTSSSAHTFQQITYLKDDVHQIDLYSYDEHRFPLTIASRLTKPYGLDPYGGKSLDTLTLYVSEETMAQICEQLETVPNIELFYTCADSAQLKSAIERSIQQQPDLQPYTQIQSIDEARSQMATLLLLVRFLLYAFLLLISIIALTNVCNTLSSSYALRAQENAMLFSIGMDKRQFRTMLIFEALSYAVKSTIYGLVLALPLCYLLYQILGMKFTFAFYLPIASILVAIAALFLVTLLMLLYHLALIRKENIIETIRKESI